MHGPHGSGGRCSQLTQKPNLVAHKTTDKEERCEMVCICSGCSDEARCMHSDVKVVTHKITLKEEM